MQHNVGLIEVIRGLAQSFYSKTGERMPWWTRIIIALVLDVIDIGIRVIFWPAFLFFPFISHPVRMVLDLILTVIGTALWGSIGLLQSFDIFLGSIPVLDLIFDALPILTISGIIARSRERKTRQHTSLVETQGGYMWILGGLVGCIVGAGLSYAGLVPLWWIGIFAFLGLFAGLTIQYEGFGIPERFYVVALITAIALFLVVAGWGTYVSYTSPESYRERAWKDLTQKGDYRIALAKKADELGKSLKIGNLLPGDTKKIREGAVGFLEEYTKPSGIPLVEALRKGVIKGLKSEPEKKLETAGEPQEKKKEPETPLAKPNENLKLGSAQLALYGSDYVLERAKEIKTENLSFWTKIIVLIGGFAAYLVIGFAVAGTNASPSSGDRDENFWGV